VIQVRGRSDGIFDSVKHNFKSIILQSLVEHSSHDSLVIGFGFTRNLADLLESVKLIEELRPISIDISGTVLRLLDFNLSIFSCLDDEILFVLV
jgi:hypothetical protein